MQATLRFSSALGRLLLVLAVLLGGMAAAAAQSRLADFLAKVPPAELMPGADRYDAPQGTPPMATVRAADRVVGYAFVNARLGQFDRLFRPADPDPRRACRRTARSPAPG